MSTSKRLTVSAIGLGMVATTVLAWAAERSGSVPEPATRAATMERSQTEALRAYAKLPLAFVENRGQTDARVKFYAQAAHAAFYLTRDQIVLSFVKASGESEDRRKTATVPIAAQTEAASRGIALSLRFLGSNPDVVLTAGERAAGEVNYLRGNDPSRWQTHLPRYGGVVYRELWPGVDLALRDGAGTLKYEFHVHPGARVADIRLAYDGADGVTLNDAGALLIATELGVLKDAAPTSYQEIGGKRVAVASRYALDDGEHGYGFAVGAGYDPTRELVIDPGVEYSTFLGGSNHDTGAGIAVDASGNAYIVGTTYSTDFPTRAGSFDRTLTSAPDVFVTKLNATGSALVYSTFLGGTPSPVPCGARDCGSEPTEFGRGIAVDSSGNAYITGQTTSGNFPTTQGAFDRSLNIGTAEGTDAFVTKLNPSGSGLVFSTFLGGTNFDDGIGIAIDGARNVYVTGETGSTNFPLSTAAFDRTPNGVLDAFVTKLNPAGSALVFSTLLGGSEVEFGTRVAADASGNTYVTGTTRSPNFPTTAGAFDRTQNGEFDAFVTKLNANGSALTFSTFLGGSGFEAAEGLAIDAGSNTYVAGGTGSVDFPATPGAFDPTFDGSDAFVTKLNPTGSALVYSTALGGTGGEGASGIALDASANAWVVGTSSSADFPTTADAFDRLLRGPSDVFLTRVNAAGSALLYSTRIGGNDQADIGNDVAVDSAGNAYVTGHTFAADFPTTPGAFDRVWSGDTLIFWGDAFVTKLSLTAAPPPPPPPVPAAPALVSPAEGAIVPSPVAFDWSDVANAVSYTIQVDEISEFGAPLIFSATTTASQLPATALPDGHWFWRVRGTNSAGTPGAWSSVRTITVQSTPPPTPPPAPGTPTLLSPANNAQIAQPFTFDWSNASGAAWYTIYVDDESSFAQPWVFAATTTPSQLAINSLPNGSLFWRVRAFNSDGVGGAFSATRSVRVGTSAPSSTPPPATPPPPTSTPQGVTPTPVTPPTATPTPAPPSGPLPAPSLQSPGSDARFAPGQSITFNWGDVAGAASYTIQIDDADNFPSPQIVNQTLAASQYATSTLPTRRMWFRVRANDAAGNPGNWSSVRRFEVKS